MYSSSKVIYDKIQAHTYVYSWIPVKARMMWNVMDRAWINLAIPNFKLFTNQGESEGVRTVVYLKNINAQDLAILLIEWGRGAEHDHVGSSMIN